jgi:hypothetical protein
MEMLLKKEIGTAKAILRGILLRYRLSGNSPPGSAGNLTLRAQDTMTRRKKKNSLEVE